MRGCSLKDMWVLFQVIEMSVIVIGNICEYIKKHRSVHSKWMGCIVCELHINKNYFQIATFRKISKGSL